METTGEVSASLAEYNGFLEHSRRLYDLGWTWPGSTSSYATRPWRRRNRTLEQLRLSVLGLVALLFLFGLALASGFTGMSLLHCALSWGEPGVGGAQ